MPLGLVDRCTDFEEYIFEIMRALGVSWLRSASRSILRSAKYLPWNRSSGGVVPCLQLRQGSSASSLFESSVATDFCEDGAVVEGQRSVVEHHAQERRAVSSRARRVASMYNVAANDDSFYQHEKDPNYMRQLKLEEDTVAVAVERYLKDVDSARQRGDVDAIRPAARLLVSWHHPLTLAIQRLMDDCNRTLSPEKCGRGGRVDIVHDAMNLLRDVSPDVLAGIVIHEVLGSLLKDLTGVPLARLAHSVGQAVQAELNVKKLRALKMAAADAEERLASAIAAGQKSPAVYDQAEEDGDTVTRSTQGHKTKPKKASKSRSHRKKRDMFEIEAEKIIANDPTRISRYSSLSIPEGVSAINYAAMQTIVDESSWSLRENVLVGTTLIDLLLKSAAVQLPPGHDQDAAGDVAEFVALTKSSQYVSDGAKDSSYAPAFRHHKLLSKRAGKTVGIVSLHNYVAKMLFKDDEELRKYVVPKQRPMLIPPRPWVSPRNGAYLTIPTHIMRAFPSKLLDDALAAADLTQVYDGLNALGETPWMVNRPVLEVVKELWTEDRAIAGLVTRRDVPMPEKTDYFDPVIAAKVLKDIRASRAHPASEGTTQETSAPSSADRSKVDPADEENRATRDTESHSADAEINDVLSAVRAYRRQRRKIRKHNLELYSLRCNTGYQIDQASSFADDDRIYLPHNIDFRGRAYPIPVYLQHMGSDLMRAMLSFAKPGIELGSRGVFWLKVHLANLLGKDKLSFDERIAFAEESIPQAVAAAAEPMKDSNLEWWSAQEDPFQLLAVCYEFQAGMGRHGGENALTGYHSTLPISMDGSCNGLQHYAALGRDLHGGKQVNLVPSPRPQDVYSGVADLVKKRVQQAVEEGDAVARVLDGKVTRKVVKQTVMTSVYGVTVIGARDQILARLKEAGGIPEDKLFNASLQLARWTLASLGDIFQGAARTMEWLSLSARAVSLSGSEVQWLTPLGLPVIQPYRKQDSATLKTVVQRLKLGSTGDHMPVSPSRQRSAFAPNYVHSLDSSHMLMTAMRCKQHGLAFAAVHDSFWTHAASVDAMNGILRETFVKLHRRELLEELQESMKLQNPNIRLPPLPKRGNLDLDLVLESPYFFS